MSLRSGPTGSTRGIVENEWRQYRDEEHYGSCARTEISEAVLMVTGVIPIEFVEEKRKCIHTKKSEVSKEVATAHGKGTSTQNSGWRR